MSDFIKQKQVENLSTTLAAKANDSQVVKIANNLSDVNAAQARTNLDIHSKAEVNALVAGASNARSVADIAGRNALTNLAVSDRIFVSDDGDSKWALYLVSSITDGAGSTSEYVKIADEDLFTNAMTAASIKTAYESNADTNAFTDTDKGKLDNITVSQPVDLDTMESDINTNKTDITTAQNTANNALSVANGKEDSFTEASESFTGMTVEENIDNDLTLTHNIKTGHEVLVFFGALRVFNITYTSGTNIVTVNVPYLTEPSDVITVTYAY